jgi:DNA polymerase-3 subunit alpha
VPVSTAVDKETGESMLVTQYEGAVIEDTGLIKMDFLGLKTLSIIKDAVEVIEQTHGVKIDIDNIPIDDKKTYELYCAGRTIGTFQFESPGMQKWLRELQPSRFEDLIAMNALYRPGPMDYIPDFVARKKGEQPIEYDLPEMESILQDTYGVTVYQEQVMLLSQKLANFTKGQADGLRKAMGKKLIDKMMELKVKFMEGGAANGHPQDTLEKIWKDWTAFAQYAFNKSHATCYAWVAYQTGYMKAHYPAEFMAANMSKNLNNIEEITKLMDECRRLGKKVLGPDVNESERTFSVNKAGDIRFGMAGVKGVGGAVVDQIVACRGDKPFTGIFDFIERASANATMNRKTVESLAYAGAFDSFPEIRREQFFSENSKGEIFLESLCRYGQKLQSDTLSGGNSLFGDLDEGFKPTPPEIPAPKDYNNMEFLKKEKELVGMYLSAHPLHIYKFEMDHFAKLKLKDALAMCAAAATDPSLRKREMYLAGLITSVNRMVSKKSGKPWVKFAIEDYDGSAEFALFGKEFENFMPFLEDSQAIMFKCQIMPKFGFGKEEEKGPDGKPLPVECELKIRKMTMLANTKEEFIRRLIINIPINKLSDDFRKDFVKVLKSNKGKKGLAINLLDFEHGYSVEHISRKFKVDVNPELLDYLTAHNLEYKVDAEVSL